MLRRGPVSPARLPAATRRPPRARSAATRPALRLARKSKPGTSRSRDDSGRQKPGGWPTGFTAHSQMNFDPTRSSSEENVMNLLQRILVVCGLVAVTALARAAAAEELKLPEGKVAIHYYRSDGGYDGWGLHVWESF